jgi:protein-disulfide isomerase
VRDASSTSSFDVAGIPAEGRPDAKVVLIEFSDYECPYCARHVRTTEDALRKHFIETGKIRHLFANNPLPMHPNATFLATSAICAGQQDQYWEMRSSIFKEGAKTKEQVLPLADRLGMDRGIFEACLAMGPHPQVKSDQALAERLQLTSTPAFGIGRLSPSGRLQLQTFIIGAQPAAVFEKALDEALSQAR